MPRNRLFPAALLLFSAVCAGAQSEAPKPGFNLFTKAQDVQLGKEAAQQVLQQSEVVQNSFLQDYLKRIGQRLASTPEAANSGFQFTFTLLNDKSVNAFALPGGPMFVYSGLLNAVDNEAQLAGVMAHEMSHVILRHGTNQASKANLLQLPAALLGAATGGSLMGQLARAGIGLGFNSVLLKFSRTDESQADNLGARMMAETGYNPIEMARFFEKLEAEGGSRGPQFLSDHPNPGNREKAIEDEIRTLPQRQYGYQTGQFNRAKSVVASLPPPTKRPQQQGAVTAPSGAAPAAGGWQQLRGRNFVVSYPPNWRAYGDNSSSSVTFAPEQGIVRTSTGDASVGYGAILSYFAPDSGARTLRSGTDDLIRQLRSNNPGMQVASGAPRSVRVDGSEGLITMLESNSPYGGAETDALLTVSRPEGLFYMVFIAPQTHFSSLQAAFQKMVNSIRFNE